MADPDFTQFKLVHKGHSFEEFHEGQVFEHHWRRTINAGDPFLGITNLEFHRPVYPGDTLPARSTVVSTRESASRGNFGIVTWRTEARNQRDELVISYERTNLVAKRRGAPL